MLALEYAAAQAPPSEAAAIHALIDRHDSALGVLSSVEHAELQALYESGRYSRLWLDAGGRPTRNADVALTLIDHADDDGLEPADYYMSELDHLMARITAISSAPPQDVARLDVTLSAAMLRYLRHVHLGRVDPRTIGFRLAVPADHDDFVALLHTALAEQRVAETAAQLRPVLTQYSLLRTMLARYRSLSADSTLLPPPPITTPIRPGQRYDGLGALYRFLLALGDLPPDTPAPAEAGPYDDRLVNGVERFQMRHGLNPDGILGRTTMAALHVPLAWRTRQIELALERLRWLPHVGNERLIALNIPMFRLWVWDASPPNGAPLFGMNVIVGRALNTQTPVFAEEMREVIFRPYWNVPRSILRHEVLPALEHDPAYLQRERMDVIQGTGDRAAVVGATPAIVARLRAGDRSLRVRQRPGLGNALGLIEFVFPNEDGIYMHGTPVQELFARSRRDFSHGCVRVEDPIALAEWVLKTRPDWTRSRIVAVTAGTQTIRVKLPQPIQVILFYATAAVMPEDHSVQFAEDIYHHDARLDRALSSRKVQQ